MSVSLHRVVRTPSVQTPTGRFNVHVRMASLETDTIASVRGFVDHTYSILMFYIMMYEQFQRVIYTILTQAKK